jgi:hypothetical protein
MDEIEQRRAQLIAALVPNLSTRWSERRAHLGRFVASVIPPGQRLLFLDERMWGPETIGDRQAMPFPARNGLFAGLPESESELVAALEASPDRYLAIPKESRWWLDHYAAFRRSIETNGQMILNNDDLTVFVLDAPVPSPEAGQ